MDRIPELAITSLETVDVFDINTGAYKFTLDELQSTTLSQSEDTTDITGKRGRRITTIKTNKTVSISGTNGIVSAGLLGAQTGSDFKNGVTKVSWIDYVTVETADTAATTYTAVGTSGAEITALYVKNADGTLGTEFKQGSAVAAGKFTYAPATKAIAFNTGAVAAGTDLVIFYERQITADVLSNDINKYAAKANVYINAIAEDTCGNVYRVQIHIPKADFVGNFSLEMGDNQTVHDFEINALAGAACKGKSGLFDITIFGNNAADA